MDALWIDWDTRLNGPSYILIKRVAVVKRHASPGEQILYFQQILICFFNKNFSAVYKENGSGVECEKKHKTER